MQGEVTLEPGRERLRHGEQLNAVEGNGDGGAVVGHGKVLPGAGDQVLAGEPLLAGYGVAVKLGTGQDVCLRSGGGRDVPGRGAAEHHVARRVEFQQKSRAGAAASKEQAGPAHDRPESGVQRETAYRRAGDGQERRAGDTKGAFEDVQRSPAARRPVDPVGTPPGVRKSGAERLGLGPGAGEPSGVTDPDPPAVVSIPGQFRTVVRNPGLAGRRNGPGIPDLSPGRVLDGDFVAGLPGRGGVGVLRLAQAPAEDRTQRRREAPGEAIRQ